MEQKSKVKAAMWTKKTKKGHDYYSVKVEATEDILIKKGESFWVNLFYRKPSSEKSPNYATIDETQDQSKSDTPDGFPF